MYVMDHKRKYPYDASDEKSIKLSCKRTDLPTRLMECNNVISRNWYTGLQLDRDDLRVSTLPFKHCVIRNLIKDEKYLEELKKELLELTFLTKQNDLYQFHQSADLLSVDKPNINCLKKFLKEECLPFVQSVTGIRLNTKVSSTCSAYTFSDHLLCHDDECEDRRIAFIFYLNENWLSEFGGDLELFSTDDNGQPDKVVSTIQPSFNSFVFFEVTNKSFHQVSEVKTVDRTRLSINGWFHDSLPFRKAVTEAPLEKHLFPAQHVANGIMSLVNSMYLKPEVQNQISTSFERESEILLPDFFESNFYDELCKCLTSNDLSWKIEGPANRRKYEILQEENVPHILKKVLELFKSEKFFQLLSNLTKLDLVPDDDDSEDDPVPLCSYQVERWKTGFYTLLHDIENKSGFALDVILYCNVPQKQQLQGGFMSYVADNADEELLMLVPSHNALALTFRDKETNRFVKYINNLFKSFFHVVSFTYYERKSTV